MYWWRKIKITIITITNYHSENKEKYFLRFNRGYFRDCLWYKRHYRCFVFISYLFYAVRLHLFGHCFVLFCFIFILCFFCADSKTTNQIHYSPRTCVFCVQFKEIVPRIVWPEQYVFSTESRVTLIFSIFSSLDEDDVWSVVGFMFDLTTDCSSELWLIAVWIFHLKKVATWLS